MKMQPLFKWFAVLVFSAGLLAGASLGQTLGSVFEMMGGMDPVSKLAGDLLKSSASDPRLAGLLGKLNASAATPKLADQMCAILDGGGRLQGAAHRSADHGGREEARRISNQGVGRPPQLGIERRQQQPPRA